MPRPFFSVCMETYNRGKTIFDALKSVQSQTFSDFEVIIVDDRSTDNTAEEIEMFLQSNLYKECPFKYTFKQNKRHLGGVKNWNKPLELASGKYIAVLEGDDQHLPTHLEEAYKILNSYDKIGIYAASNQNRIRPLLGLIDAEAYFRYIYKIEDVPPPSETIFTREYNNKQYFYNDEDYDYAPEIALYLEISSDGLKAYHSNKQTVIRGVSLSEVGYTWGPFKDRFGIFEQYKDDKYINQNTYVKTLNFHVNRALVTFYNARIRNVGKPDDIFHGIKEILRDESHLPKFRYYYELYRLKILSSDIIIKCEQNKVLIRAYHFYKTAKQIMSALVNYCRLRLQ